MLLNHLQDDIRMRAIVAKAEREFARANIQRLRRDKLPLPDTDLEALKAVLQVSPLHFGIVDAAENWIVEVCKDTARAPNDNEWARLLTGPLDGLIGMSLALQWRYNFGPLFGRECDDHEE